MSEFRGELGKQIVCHYCKATTFAPFVSKSGKNRYDMQPGWFLELDAENKETFSTDGLWWVCPKCVIQAGFNGIASVNGVDKAREYMKLFMPYE